MTGRRSGIRKKNLVFILTCVVLSVLMAGLPVSAQGTGRTADTKIINMVDPGGPAGGNTTVGLLGSFVGSAADAVSRINAIRKEACEEGVPDPRNSGRNLTSGDYVPIQWDSDLEYIARVRAAEASIYISHTRPSGKDTWTAKAPSGAQSYGENLAWNYDSQIRPGIEQWYEEKEDWLIQNTGAVTGHYTSMINPDYRYFGIASFVSGGGVYPNSTCAEFSYSASGGTNTMGEASDCLAVIEIASSVLSDPCLLVADRTSTDGLDVGDTLKLELGMKAVLGNRSSLVFDPDDITWSSSASSVMTTGGYGFVKVNGTGTSVIRAVSKSGRSATMELVSSHTPGNWIITEEATCVKAGKRIRKCTGCEETLEEEIIPAAGHSPGDWTEVKPASCTEEGTKIQKCTVCGETIHTMSVPATGHQEVTDAGVSATCTKNGKTQGSHCAVCGTVLKAGQIIPATGHSPGDWTEEEPASCREEGTMVQECTVCGETIHTMSIPATGHTWDTDLIKATTSKDGSIIEECSACGEVGLQKTIPYPKTVKLAKSSYTYNGKARKPEVIVRGSDGNPVDSSAYTIKYSSGRKKAGTYSVTIQFKGNYTGSVTKSFTIRKAKQVITVKNGSRTYKKSALKKKKQSFSIGAGASGKGKITYKSGKPKYVSVSSKGKVTVKKGTPKGTYKVTVTAAATANFKKATRTIRIVVK